MPLKQPLSFQHVEGWETPGASKTNLRQAEAAVALVQAVIKGNEVGCLYFIALTKSTHNMCATARVLVHQYMIAGQSSRFAEHLETGSMPVRDTQLQLSWLQLVTPSDLGAEAGAM